MPLSIFSPTPKILLCLIFPNLQFLRVAYSTHSFPPNSPFVDTYNVSKFQPCCLTQLLSQFSMPQPIDDQFVTLYFPYNGFFVFSTTPLAFFLQEVFIFGTRFEFGQFEEIPFKIWVQNLTNKIAMEKYRREVAEKEKDTMGCEVHCRWHRWWNVFGWQKRRCRC